MKWGRRWVLPLFAALVDEVGLQVGYQHLKLHPGQLGPAGQRGCPGGALPAGADIEDVGEVDPNEPLRCCQKGGSFTRCWHGHGRGPRRESAPLGPSTSCLDLEPDRLLLLVPRRSRERGGPGSRPGVGRVSQFQRQPAPGNAQGAVPLRDVTSLRPRPWTAGPRMARVPGWILAESIDSDALPLASQDGCTRRLAQVPQWEITAPTRSARRAQASQRHCHEATDRGPSNAGCSLPQARGGSSSRARRAARHP
jgi:hypothetical protein